MHRPPGEVWNSWQFTGGAKVIVVCWLWPFKLAVKVASWLELTFPEIASKVALVCPAGTVILGGTVSNVVLLAIDTSESVVRAVSRVTAHLPDAWLDIAEGEQCSDLGCPLVALWSVRAKV